MGSVLSERAHTGNTPSSTIRTPAQQMEAGHMGEGRVHGKRVGHNTKESDMGVGGAHE